MKKLLLLTLFLFAAPLTAMNTVQQERFYEREQTPPLEATTLLQQRPEGTKQHLQQRITQAYQAIRGNRTLLLEKIHHPQSDFNDDLLIPIVMQIRETGDLLPQISAELGVGDQHLKTLAAKAKDVQKAEEKEYVEVLSTLVFELFQTINQFDYQEA
jgi:hypothetical protein